MEKIIINEDGLLDEEVDKKTEKVRAILYCDDEILIANYGGNYILPGGKIDTGESVISALQRELKEETGIFYSKEQLTELFVLRYYQKKYITVDNEELNRLVTTYYYVGMYKGIDLATAKRSNNEEKGKFSLRLVKEEELDKLILLQSDNPRNAYFNRELGEALKVYKKGRRHV